MNNSINICNRCDREIAQNKKDHNYNYHTDEVFIGESLLSVKRSIEGFICPVCESILNTTTGFRHHSKHHNLNFRISKKRVNDEDIDHSHEFNESEEFEISEISKDLLLNHIPPSSLSLNNASNPQKKKLKLTNSETILASSDSLTADNQTESDKIMIAKLGRWVPLIYNRGNQQYGVLASPSSASLLLQDSQEPGTWESPIPDGETCSTSLVKTDGDNLIAHIKSTSKACRKLSTTCHIESSQRHVRILNQDWLEYPQLRFCAHNSGAIIIEKQTSILVNTVEPYARDPLLDAHYERSTAKSSFPTEPGIYGYIRICLLDSPDGKKLVLGTRVCNFLVTSSMCLDVNSCNIGPSTTHFTPSNESRVFLDNSSIQFVTEMIENPDTNECQVMPVLNQLRQLRSKFDCLSTYSKCRASSSIASHPSFQPTTIWTLILQDNLVHKNLSQNRLSSLLFRTIATKVFRFGRDATIGRDEVLTIVSQIDDELLSTVFKKILGSFSEHEEVLIIENAQLNSQLTDLANGISKKKQDERLNGLNERLYRL